jgi:hypothetical protein
MQFYWDDDGELSRAGVFNSRAMFGATERAIAMIRRTLSACQITVFP